jgi:hypothetical protein
MNTAARRARLPVTRMRQVAATWSDLEDWLKLVITLMVRHEFRGHG